MISPAPQPPPPMTLYSGDLSRGYHIRLPAGEYTIGVRDAAGATIAGSTRRLIAIAPRRSWSGCSPRRLPGASGRTSSSPWRKGGEATWAASSAAAKRPLRRRATTIAAPYPPSGVFEVSGVARYIDPMRRMIQFDDGRYLSVDENVQLLANGSPTMLSTLAPGTFEIALDIHPDDETDRSLLDQHGWTLADPAQVAAHPVEVAVFSDFRHGIFNKLTIPQLTRAVPAGVIRVADSQVANRWGNILEFQDFDLIAPNEREARFALGDQDSTVRPLALELYKKARCKTLILKLGERGIITYTAPSHDVRSFFTIDSFAERIVDPVGAGSYQGEPALAARPDAQVRVFLMADSVGCAKAGQKVPEGYYNAGDLVRMVGGEVALCGTCMDARGIGVSDVVEGARPLVGAPADPAAKVIERHASFVERGGEFLSLHPPSPLLPRFWQTA